MNATELWFTALNKWEDCIKWILHSESIRYHSRPFDHTSENIYIVAMVILCCCASNGNFMHFPLHIRTISKKGIWLQLPPKRFIIHFINVCLHSILASHTIRYVQRACVDYIYTIRMHIIGENENSKILAQAFCVRSFDITDASFYLWDFSSIFFWVEPGDEWLTQSGLFKTHNFLNASSTLACSASYTYYVNLSCDFLRIIVSFLLIKQDIFF